MYIRGKVISKFGSSWDADLTLDISGGGLSCAHNEVVAYQMGEAEGTPFKYPTHEQAQQALEGALAALKDGAEFYDLPEQKFEGRAYFITLAHNDGVGRPTKDAIAGVDYWTGGEEVQDDA